MDLEPVAKRNDIVYLYGDKIDHKYFRVWDLEGIQPQRRDVGSLGASASASVSADDVKSDMQLTEGELAQYVILPLDDIEITLSQPAAAPKYTIKGTQTAIKKDRPKHYSYIRDNTADTDAPIWQVTSGRRARLTGMVIHNESTSQQIVRIGDGSASVANAVLSVPVPANDYIVLSKTDLHELYFYGVITVQHDSANYIRATVYIEEDEINPFSQTLENTVFVLGDGVPTILVTNPTAVTQPANRYAWYGVKYILERVEKQTPDVEIPVGGLGD